MVVRDYLFAALLMAVLYFLIHMIRGPHGHI